MIGNNLFEQDENILGGTLVFAKTRVPVKTMFDYLAAGQTLDEFLDDFPTVERLLAVKILQLIPQWLTTLFYENTSRRIAATQT